jgi:hypothetical protein
MGFRKKSSKPKTKDQSPKKLMKRTRNIFWRDGRLRAWIAFALLLTLMLSHTGCFLDEQLSLTLVE